MFDFCFLRLFTTFETSTECFAWSSRINPASIFCSKSSKQTNTALLQTPPSGSWDITLMLPLVCFICCRMTHIAETKSCGNNIEWLSKLHGQIILQRKCSVFGHTVTAPCIDFTVYADVTTHASCVASHLIIIQCHISIFQYLGHVNREISLRSGQQPWVTSVYWILPI